MIKTVAVFCGLLFLALGIVGFIPGVTVNQKLFGTLHANGLHSMVHIITGMIAMLCGAVSRSAARRFFQIFGIIYALIAIFGFYYGSEPVFGLLSNNRPDIGLHIVLGVIMLLLGFASAKSVS